MRGKPTIRAAGGPRADFLEAVRLHQDGRLKQAEKIYRRVLSRAPDFADALHMLGVLRHQQGRARDAIKLLDRAVSANPNDAAALYHQGEALSALGRTAHAIAAYERARALSPDVADIHFALGNAYFDGEDFERAAAGFRAALAINPADAECLNNLGNSLARLGRADEAIEAYRQAVEADPAYADAPVNLAIALDERGEGRAAIEVLEQAAARQGENVEIMRQLGRLHERQGRYNHAEACYRLAVARAPDDAALQRAFGRVLTRQGRPRQAVAACRRALALEPDSTASLITLAAALREADQTTEALALARRALQRAPEEARTHIALGRALAAVGEETAAVAAFQKALEIDPDNADAAFNIAHLSQTLGRFDEAIEWNRRAIAANSRYTLPYIGLASNKAFKPDQAFLDAIEALLAGESLTEAERVNLEFALAQSYDGMKRYDEAFEHFRAGNALKAAELAYDIEGASAHVDDLIATFSAEFFAARTDFGIDEALPVFIVGMPRSGTTLVEQILASHPAVHGAGELNHIRRMIERLDDRLRSDAPYPANVESMTAPQARELAEEHIVELRQLSETAQRITDKMPGNYMRLGLIALLFPKAAIIHCRRDPVDTCLSCYFQIFAYAQEFSYDLRHLGRTWRDYARLMDHWHRVLPGRILDVVYEDLVADQERVSRRMVEFCGLAWDDACLDYHRQRREIQTASFWQARQPIYKSSVARWRRYEKHLGPLLAELGDPNEARQ